MNPSLEIFSQGEEIVTGQTVDSNAAWLSQQAVQIGFAVTRHTAVGDKLDDLVELLQEISQRADCCICTGGLGPTCDDLTAEAVAKAFGLPLAFDEIAFADIEQFFANRSRSMPESNRKQAMLPKGAARLDNEWGTAPGFALQQQRCWFVFLPGVPSEMRLIFLEKILPLLKNRFFLQPRKLFAIKTIGIGESAIQESINAIPIPEQVQLGFRATLDEVQTKLLFPYAYPEEAMTSLVSAVARQLGDAVFSIDRPGEPASDLFGVIDQLMMRCNKTLAVVETVSQGLLAAKCIGASWLLSACYEQSITGLKQKLSLALDTDDMIMTAKTLAGAVQIHSNADIVLVQLYAEEPQTLHNKDKPIILYNVLLAGDDFQQTLQVVAGSIKRKQNQSALLALDLLRRYLLA